jgi:hypothetical protein
MQTVPSMLSHTGALAEGLRDERRAGESEALQFANAVDGIGFFYKILSIPWTNFQSVMLKLELWHSKLAAWILRPPTHGQNNTDLIHSHVRSEFISLFDQIITLI